MQPTKDDYGIVYPIKGIYQNGLGRPKDKARR
jgi:hypothetical protein